MSWGRAVFVSFLLVVAIAVVIGVLWGVWRLFGNTGMGIVAGLAAFSWLVVLVKRGSE